MMDRKINPSDTEQLILQCNTIFAYLLNEYTEGTFQVEIKDADMQAMSEIADAISILTLWTRDSTSSFSHS
jgi:hypothetical protein